MTKENILERTNFADEVICSGDRSFLDPKTNETFYKQEHGPWIIIDNKSAEYRNTDTNPKAQSTLDNILQKKLNEKLETRRST